MLRMTCVLMLLTVAPALAQDYTIVAISHTDNKVSELDPLTGETLALDANLGPVFYTLRQEESDTPDFQRQTGLCLQCHDTYGLRGGGIPRFLIRSGPTDSRGRSATHGSWRLTTDETPLSRRWGGW